MHQRPDVSIRGSCAGADAFIACHQVLHTHAKGDRTRVLFSTLGSPKHTKQGKCFGAHIQHGVHRCAFLMGKARDVEPPASVPAHLQLLLSPVQQVIQRLIVDLTVRCPGAANAYETWVSS